MNAVIEKSIAKGFAAANTQAEKARRHIARIQQCSSRFDGLVTSKFRPLFDEWVATAAQRFRADFTVEIEQSEDAYSRICVVGQDRIHPYATSMGTGSFSIRLDRRGCSVEARGIVGKDAPVVSKIYLITNAAAHESISAESDMLDSFFGDWIRRYVTAWTRRSPELVDYSL